MARFRNSLNHVQVAAPCPADWEQMIGSDRVRFCAQCNLNVYNLSGMQRAEAEALIARTENRLCIRFYRRADGSIITRDCPIGLRAIQRRVSYFTKALIAATLTFLASLGFQSLLPAIPGAGPQRTMGVMVSPGRQIGEPLEPVSITPREPISVGQMVIREDLPTPRRFRKTNASPRS